MPLQVSWQSHGCQDLGQVVTGCQVYGRVLDLLDKLRPVLLFQSCTSKCLLLVSMLLGDLVQYSHNVIISLFHRKASGRPYLFHFEKAARFAFSLTTSFVFTYCSSISHIAGCWSVASSKAQVVCLRGQSSWWQRGNWGKVKSVAAAGCTVAILAGASTTKPMPTVTL